MKRYGLIGAFMFLMLAGCHRPAETTYTPSQSALSAIDTLMQSRPDSALALLWASPMDDPYYQLLLSEALYKNDSAQLNRPKLLKALAYFDSLAYPFLSARCHYMNGVGYYEMDSVVQACEQYLKALEIMEEHYEEKDLVGYKAKFMALVYTHLCGLFSDQYLHEQAIYFGKHSLPYYYCYEAELGHIAWMHSILGVQYDMLERWDSADYYYRQAMQVIPDSNTLIYRDVSAVRALLSYNINSDVWCSLKRLLGLLERSESEKEYLSRCAVIGEIFYREEMYDSAWNYLNPVYQGNSSLASKKQAAEWLIEICKHRKESSELYTAFLVPFVNQEENKSELKSQLSELYSRHVQSKQERSYRLETRHRMNIIAGWALVLFALVLLALAIINKNRKRWYDSRIEEERRVHDAKQKAISGRLKQSNEALRLQSEENEKLQQELKKQEYQTTWGYLDNFISEDICKEILTSLHGKTIKREAKRGDYSELRLNDEQLSKLLIAVERHFEGFSHYLTDLYPKINRNELHQCLLCLLNLEDVQIAALLHSDYSTIKKRAAKMKKAFHTDKSLQMFIREIVL